jgi:hypothetical protein
MVLLKGSQICTICVAISLFCVISFNVVAASDAGDLFFALKKACSTCSIEGITIADPSDRTTWHVDYTQGFTPSGAQASTIAATIAAFNINALSGSVTVTRMQAIIALSRAGILASVQSWITSQGAETQLIWNNAPNFSRNSTLLNAAATALGLSSAQVDALFITAQSINP